MTAAIYDINIEQGSTFELEIEYLDDDSNAIDLSTVSTIEMEIRPTAGGALYGQFTMADGFFTVTDAANGEFKLLIPYSVTEDLLFTNALYDIEIEFASGLKERICEGRVYLRHEVTTGDMSNTAMASFINYTAAYKPDFSTLAGVPIKIDVATSLVKKTADFLHTSNRATYTGPVSKNFAVYWSVSASFTEPTVPTTFTIYKNGARVADSEQDGLRSTAGVVGNNMGPVLVSLSENDYIEMWLTNGKDTAVSIKHLSVMVVSI